MRAGRCISKTNVMTFTALLFGSFAAEILARLGSSDDINPIRFGDSNILIYYWAGALIAEAAGIGLQTRAG